VFRKAVIAAGFNDRSVLSWLKTNGLIQVRNKGYTKNKRINGIVTDCVVMKLHSSEDVSLEEYEELI